MSEEIVSSEDIQFYEYLGLLEQAYYDTHVGSKAGTIITETIKSYVNILKYKNNKLQQKVEQLMLEIDRLNNIINELEEIINYEIEKWQNTDDELMKARVQEDKHILDVIQELKDSD